MANQHQPPWQCPACKAWLAWWARDHYCQPTSLKVPRLKADRDG